MSCWKTRFEIYLTRMTDLINRYGFCDPKQKVYSLKQLCCCKELSLFQFLLAFMVSRNMKPVEMPSILAIQNRKENFCPLFFFWGGGDKSCSTLQNLLLNKCVQDCNGNQVKLILLAICLKNCVFRICCLYLDSLCFLLYSICFTMPVGHCKAGICIEMH